MALFFYLAQRRKDAKRNANLRKANLQSAMLNGANLTEIQAIEATFTAATLTGVCIKDWNWGINQDTIFDSVMCDYIYLDFTETKNPLLPPYFNTLKRYPRLLGITYRNFNSGEFTKLCQDKNTQLINYRFHLKQLISSIENDRNLDQERKERVRQKIFDQVQKIVNIVRVSFSEKTSDFSLKSFLGINKPGIIIYNDITSASNSATTLLTFWGFCLGRGKLNNF